MMFFTLTAGLALLPNTLLGVAAHSWVEQMLVISNNGSYTGEPGYMRGYVPRGAGFADGMNVNLLPPLATGRTVIDQTDLMCKSTQSISNNTNGFPKLNAAPGDYIALRYLENGHVTLPQNQEGKPGSGGTVMVYATNQPKSDEKLTDVLQWNTDGTGGDKRGKLLTVQNFDDGRCYQINSGPISTQRQQEFPNKPANAAPGTLSAEMWCETDVKLPTDATTGADLTLYWAWQWDTKPNMNPGLPTGKDEWYTSCIDVAVMAEGQIKAASATPPTNLLVQDPQKMANPNYVERAANTTLPSGGPDGKDLGNNSTSSSSPAAAPAPAAPVASAAPAAPAAAQPTPQTPAAQGAPQVAPIPNTTPTAGSGVAVKGASHVLIVTQVFTVTYVDKKRSVQRRTVHVPDVVAAKRRNVFA